VAIYLQEATLLIQNGHRLSINVSYMRRESCQASRNSSGLAVFTAFRCAPSQLA
jgi:hypothetical protein